MEWRYWYIVTFFLHWLSCSTFHTCLLMSPLVLLDFPTIYTRAFTHTYTYTPNPDGWLHCSAWVSFMILGSPSSLHRPLWTTKADTPHLFQLSQHFVSIQPTCTGRIWVLNLSETGCARILRGLFKGFLSELVKGAFNCKEPCHSN